MVVVEGEEPDSAEEGEGEGDISVLVPWVHRRNRLVRLECILLLLLPPLERLEHRFFHRHRPLRIVGLIRLLDIFSSRGLGVVNRLLRNLPPVVVVRFTLLVDLVPRVSRSNNSNSKCTSMVLALKFMNCRSMNMLIRSMRLIINTNTNRTSTNTNTSNTNSNIRSHLPTPLLLISNNHSNPSHPPPSLQRPQA